MYEKHCVYKWKQLQQYYRLYFPTIIYFATIKFEDYHYVFAFSLVVYRFYAYQRLSELVFIIRE